MKNSLILKPTEKTTKVQAKEEHSMTHGERYQYLVEHQEGGKVTNYYRSAFYILSSTPFLFEKSKKYATGGIDFSMIKSFLHYGDSYLKVVVNVAENLYTSKEYCMITPREIALLPPSLFELVVEAMQIAAGNCSVEVVDGEFQFDFSKCVERKEKHKISS